MSWRVCKQPNGKFAIWSTVVDNWIMTDGDAADVRDMFLEESRQLAINAARRALSKATVALWHNCEEVRKSLGHTS